MKVIKTNIKILYRKWKFGKIGPKTEVNLHENSRTSQFEDNKYRYGMIKGFLNSNPDLGKCLYSIKILWDQNENYVVVNLTFP